MDPTKAQTLNNASEQQKKDPVKNKVGLFSTPHIFLGVALVLFTRYSWATRWVLSGTAILTYCILLGAAQGYRILAFIPLWALVTGLNLIYAVSATSWLLYWVFLVNCYVAVVITSLFQFDAAANFMRNRLSTLLKQLYFTNDKIAFFDLPALEIDVDVDGLMVIRGLTISLSHLTVEAHGIEVGIKLSDDMELALQVDDVKISFFRRIDIGDVYGNLKGGEYEMTFGNLAERTTNEEGTPLMHTDTPLLAAAAEGVSAPPEKAPMIETMTDGKAPQATSAQGVYDSITAVSPEDPSGRRTYQDTIDYIRSTSMIEEARIKVRGMVRRATTIDTKSFDPSDVKDMRATICSQLHDKPSIPHPPRRSIRVTTLQNLSSPRVRKFLHRLPFLLRLLLNPLCYFHPIYIKSITAGASGKWIEHMLQELVFKGHDDAQAGVKNLHKRVSTWLHEANFVLQLVDIMALAQVPINTTYDIINQLKIDDLLAYRTIPEQINLKQVVRVGGADATISVPSFLLPHHEHLLPEYKPADKIEEHEQAVEDADGAPKTIQAQQALSQVKKDETNFKVSAHVRLPAVCDQELLDWIAALVKATKVIEMDKDPELKSPDLKSPSTVSLNGDHASTHSEDEPEHDEEGEDADADADIETASVLSADTTASSVTSPTKKKHRLRFKELTSKVKADLTQSITQTGDFTKALNKTISRNMKRAAVDAVANDRWIAKLVGKVTKKLETAQGEVGYSGDVPLSLEPYRRAAETETKLLP